jgi:hypothetical protein
MNIYDVVHEKTKKSLNVVFDDKLYSIRRNLMVVSTIVISSTFISPLKAGSYEVNIGLIKGILEEPVYLYYFLAVSCLYYLVWFYIHCRSVVVLNYDTIKFQFMNNLGAIRAEEKYSLIRYDHKKNNTPFSISLTPKGGGGGSGKWISEFRMNENVKQHKPEWLESLRASGFDIQESHGELLVSFTYSPILEDFQYLKYHLDLYWRGRLSYLFTTALPIFYASLSLIILSGHIYGLIKS